MDVAPSRGPQRVGKGYIAMPPGGGIHAIKIGASFAQDLIGLAKLAVLPLQDLELGGYVRGQARLAPAVALGLANPLMQRLRSAADLARNRDQRCPTRRMFMLMIQNHPHRAGSHLRRELVRCLARHGSPFSAVEASGKPGAVHTRKPDRLTYFRSATPRQAVTISALFTHLRSNWAGESADGNS